MSQQSNIEWTDATWNPVRGCVKVSPGCAHCYAETFAERFRGVKGHPYEQGFDVRLVPEKLAEPLSWKKPRRVFVNSMSDLFQDGVPDSYIDQVFAVMALAGVSGLSSGSLGVVRRVGGHTFQVLTKRAERMRYYVASWTDFQCPSCSDFHQRCPESHWRPWIADRVARACGSLGFSLGAAAQVNAAMTSFAIDKKPLPNVWLGVSVENQHFADERIPLLLQTPAAVRFISAEPLLGPVDLTAVRHTLGDESFSIGSALDGDDGFGLNAARPRLDWVIVGGESGPGARPFDVLWARQIVQQCQAGGVPCFVKQLGANPIQLDGDHVRFQSKKGGEPSEWPEDLRVREFPRIEVPA